MFRKPVSHNRFPQDEKRKKKILKNPHPQIIFCNLASNKNSSNIAVDWIKQQTATTTACEFSPKSENCQLLPFADNYQLATKNTHPPY